MAARVLVVDDTETVRLVVARYLRREGFETLVAADGEEALRLASQADVIILDLMLPKMDGYEVCRRVRATAAVPIIILSAKGRVRDKLAGLGIGADDYVVKPFSLPELAARVRARLRHVQPELAGEDLILIGELRIDTRTGIVDLAGAVVHLTEREYDLLLFLARHLGTTFSRDQLLDHVWGGAVAGAGATVTVYVGRIREKIEPEPALPRFLHTVRGVGYKLEA